METEQDGEGGSPLTKFNDQFASMGSAPAGLGRCGAGLPAPSARKTAPPKAAAKTQLNTPE